MSNRRGIAPRLRMPLFEDFSVKFLEWSQANHRPATTRLHHCNIEVLKRFFGSCRLDEIAPAAVEDFKIRRLRETRRRSNAEISPATVNRAISTLRLIYSLAIRSEEFGTLRNPAASVKRFRERACMRVVSRAEESRYFAAVVSRNLRDVAALMLDLGMRPHEILGLAVRDVDLGQRVVHVASRERGSVVVVFGKTPAAQRTLPLTARAVEIFRRRIDRAPGRFLFPGRGGRDHLLSVRQQHVRTVARAKIEPGFRLYDLRHTFATRLAEAGVPLPVLSALLGHRDGRMVFRYCHPQQAALREAINLLDQAS